MLAGGVGAVCRFVVDGEIKARVGDRFPWGTLIINVSGSFALGVLTGLALNHGAPSDVRNVLGVGFCGGYTTFSTASFETVRLAHRGSPWLAATYTAASASLALAAAALGLVVTA